MDGGEYSDILYDVKGRTATITFNIANVVWYVNHSAGAGNGRSNTPFNTLNAAEAPSAAVAQRLN